MATLAEDIAIDETDWLVSDDIPDSVDYLTVESEVVQVTATFPAQYQRGEATTSAPRIRVVRGMGGTTAATHANGTALMPLIPPSSSAGGAGLTLDNTVDPPTAITTLVAPGATISGDEGTLPLSVVQTITTLTNDQIKALPTTPVEVVASPGANKAIVAIRGLARLDWVADYTNVDAGAEIQIDGLGPLTDVAGLLALGHSSSAFFVPTARSTAVGTFIAAESGWADEDYIDRPFVIAAVNTGDFTGGNAGNSLKVSILYTVIDF
jgi:hypothetical protein